MIRLQSAHPEIEIITGSLCSWLCNHTTWPRLTKLWGLKECHLHHHQQEPHTHTHTQYLPRSSNFSSLWESLLSRFSCLSIALWILMRSRSSPDKQQSHSLILSKCILFSQICAMTKTWSKLFKVKWQAENKIDLKVYEVIYPGTRKYIKHIHRLDYLQEIHRIPLVGMFPQ